MYVGKNGTAIGILKVYNINTAEELQTSHLKFLQKHIKLQSL